MFRYIYSLTSAFTYIGNVKRIYAILLLAILTVNAMGFYLYYALQLQKIHAEMREALKFSPEHELEVLELSHAGYKNAKVDDHEVRVKGKMYDIARIKVLKDSVVIFCVHDEKEDDLLAFVAEIISKPLNTKDSMPGVIIQFLSLMFITPCNEIQLQALASEQGLTDYLISSSEIFLFRISPPPRTAIL